MYLKRYFLALSTAFILALTMGCSPYIRGVLQASGNLGLGGSSSPAVLVFDNPASASATFPNFQDVTFTVSNTGGSTATGMNFTGLSGHFSNSGGTCAGTLVSGASCTYLLRFSSPGQVVASDTIVLDYNNGVSAQQVTKAVTATGNSMPLSIAAVYPINGANWNDYIKNNNGGTNNYDQPDVACTGLETGSYSTCIHGGEKKKIVVTGVTSCNGLTIEDALGAFDWVCSTSTGTATFYTGQLKTTKGLKDLLNWGSWKDNSIRIWNGNYIAVTSSSAAWWGNTVVALPGNPLSSDTVITLSDAGKIYTAPNSTTSSGYNINADKISVVTLAGATLTYSGRGFDNCNQNTGEIASPDQRSLFCAGNQNFIWIEGNFDGDASTDVDKAVDVANVKFSRLNQINVKNSFDSGIFMIGADSNKVTSIQISNSAALQAWAAFQIYGSDYNSFYDIRVSGSRFEHLNLGGGSDNDVFNQVILANSFHGGTGWNSFSVTGNGGHTLVGLNSTNSGNTNLRLDNGTSNNTVSHVLSANSHDEGVNVNETGTVENTLNQIVSVNSNRISNWSNLYIETEPSDLLFSQLVLANANNGYGIDHYGNNVSFTNNFLVGNNSLSNCNVSGGVNQGLVNGTCANAGSSNANLVTGINLANSFVGKVTTNDYFNTSDSGGTASYATTLDWTNFENKYRGWGADGGAFPVATNAGPCESGTCRIWDWRLRLSDTMIRNKSGDGSTSNAPFTVGASCPSAVNGNETLTDQYTIPRTFLVNAVEIVNDPIKNASGNNNGLCESGEGCVYSPNFGAYQGEGVLIGPCTFQDGTVSGVSMYAWSINGVGASGALDASFDSDGEVLVSTSNNDSAKGFITIQPDGKIIGVGTGSNGVDAVFKISRTNLDGSLDSTFNGGGQFEYSLGSGVYIDALSVALQRDGKFIVGGRTWGADYDMLMVRFNANGTLDTGFGVNGVWTYNSGGNWDAIMTIAFQVDGKILAGGVWGATSNAVVFRFHPDGALDTTFGTGGYRVFTGAFQGVEAMALQSDGNIVVTGDGLSVVKVARLLATNGDLDTSFNGTGEQTITPVTYAGATSHAIAIQSDGKILAGGIDHTYPTTGELFLTRLNSDGSLDTSFNGTGKLNINLAGMTYETIRGIIALSDGRILIAGDDCYLNACLGGQDQAFVIRLLPNGSYDTSFGTAGMTTYWNDGALLTRVRGLGITPDHRILVSGSKNGSRLSILRFWP